MNGSRWRSLLVGTGSQCLITRNNLGYHYYPSLCWLRCDGRLRQCHGSWILLYGCRHRVSLRSQMTKLHQRSFYVWPHQMTRRWFQGMDAASLSWGHTEQVHSGGEKCPQPKLQAAHLHSNSAWYLAHIRLPAKPIAGQTGAQNSGSVLRDLRDPCWSWTWPTCFCTVSE